MSDTVKLGFELDGLDIPITSILPAKVINDRVRKSSRYATVKASIEEVGVIEPPVVFPVNDGAGASSKQQYLLLDGHLRIEALKVLGYTSVFCLISTDDESYTYNHRVNRLMPIQEHFMIMRAVERGVSQERIAHALQVDVARIREKRNLLRGICPEAVDILKETPIRVNALQHLRKVKPVRQVEIAELMVMCGVYSYPYCQGLVAATPKELLVGGGESSTKSTFQAEELAAIQREMESLHHDLQAHEETYGQNFLKLVMARGYLAKLLENAAVVRFLTNNHPDILSGFQQIVESTSLES